MMQKHPPDSASPQMIDPSAIILTFFHIMAMM